MFLKQHILQRKWAGGRKCFLMSCLQLNFIFLKHSLASEKQKGIENGNMFCSNATGDWSDSVPAEFDVKRLLTSA